jgi:hypothetical protein
VLNIFDSHAQSVHIVHSDRLELPDFLTLSPPAPPGSPAIEDEADELGTGPATDDPPDDPVGIAFSEEVSFDQLVETASATLDLPDCAECLDVSLDGALSAIDGTIEPEVDGKCPAFLKPPTREQLLRINATLVEVRKKLRLVTADQLAGRVKLARAWRLIHQHNSYIK